MRSAILMLLAMACVAEANSKPGWGGVGFAFGGPPGVTGKLKERFDEAPCERTSCGLTSRVRVGGGYGRWGVELQLGAGPVEDSFSMDYRDRDRHAFLWGPMVRYSLLQKWGFDLSIRAGLQHGHVSGTEQKERAVGCDGPCPTTTTYEPPEYGMWAITTGATFQFRIPAESGYVGLFADLDYTRVRVSYPDTALTGGLTSKTYGVVFGSRFR